MDIPNSLSNSDVVHSGEPETACDDNDMDSAPETELELCHINAIQVQIHLQNLLWYIMLSTV